MEETILTKLQSSVSGVNLLRVLTLLPAQLRHCTIALAAYAGFLDRRYPWLWALQKLQEVILRGYHQFGFGIWPKNLFVGL